MSLWPRSLVWRLGGALLVAIAGVAALNHAVQAEASAGKPRARLQDPVAAAPVEEFRVPRLAVPFVGGPILLALRPGSLEPTVAPVVQVLGDGGVALRRPMPRAEGPRPLDRSLERGAAIVLPGPVFADYDARARASFLELVGQLVAERPVSPSRFRTVDFALPVADLERLLRWLP